MQTIRAAAVSMNGFLGEPERLGAIGAGASGPPPRGPSWSSFPSWLYTATARRTLGAGRAGAGTEHERLAQLGRKYRQFLCVGLSEKERDIVYNTAVLVGPDGFIGKQRKLHMSRDEVLFYKGGKEIKVFDIGKCKVGVVDLLRQPVPGDCPRAGAARRRRAADAARRPLQAVGRHARQPRPTRAARSHRFIGKYALRARENACFGILTDQVGRAGYVDMYPRDHENQPHHAGCGFIWGPDGELLAQTQEERIKEEMIVATLEAGLLSKERSLANYMLRTRRPELFEELVKDQVSC